MSDIKVSIVLSLLGTILPNMGAQDPSSSRINDMSSRMESPEGISSLDINTAMNFSSDNIHVNSFIEVVQKSMAYFLNSFDLKDLVSNFDCTQIMNLAT